MKTSKPGDLAIYLEHFFVDYLMRLRAASTHTIASYRDTFRLFLKFIEVEHNKSPFNLNVKEINCDMVRNFLTYLEDNRGMKSRSRNQRLSALRSFYRYLLIECPELSLTIQKILSIPQKRYESVQVHFLNDAEVKALLEAPDQTTKQGRRDFTLILFLVQTGLRVSELINLKIEDVHIGATAYVTCMGKGRKHRTTPLTKRTAKIIRAWCSEQDFKGSDFLFNNAREKQFSVDGIRYILRKYSVTASQICPSLAKKKVTPHVIRHTTAMQLLFAGVDISTIALWLGHESIETTKQYLEADLKQKEEALKKVNPQGQRPFRYKPKDKLIRFLESL